MTSVFLYKERQKASRAVVKDNGNSMIKAQLPSINDSGNSPIVNLLPSITIKLTLILKNPLL